MRGARPPGYDWRMTLPRRTPVLLACLLISGCAAVAHPIYGVREGSLAECDGVAGCLSTQSPQQSVHHVAPIAFRSVRSDARSDLVTTLRMLGGNRIVSSHRSYLRAEFTAGDVLDDVEFYLPVDDRVIHIRSVTRDGMEDSGEHRGRIERIRRTFDELQDGR